jgi:hypothetical protein
MRRSTAARAAVVATARALSVTVIGASGSGRGL